jgi:hypothetical protein
MKKICFLVCAMVMSLCLIIACGNNNDTSNKDTNVGSNTSNGTTLDGSTAIRDINANNWQAVIKANFGIDLSLPDSWTVKEVSSPNNLTNVKMFFNVGGSVSLAEFAETIFNVTKAVTKKDITRDGNICNSFSDAVTMNGISTWHYYLDDNKAIRINAYYDNNTLEITIQG